MKRSLVSLVLLLLLLGLGIGVLSCSVQSPAPEAKLSPAQVKIAYVLVPIAGKESGMIDVAFEIDNQNPVQVSLTDMNYNLSIEGLELGGGSVIASTVYIPAKKKVVFEKSFGVTTADIMRYFILKNALGPQDATAKAGAVVKALTDRKFNLRLNGAASFQGESGGSFGVPFDFTVPVQP